MELIAIESQESVNAAWEVEIDSRLRGIADGSAKLYPADSTLEKLREKFTR